jgi:hypothetical protein
MTRPLQFIFPLRNRGCAQQSKARAARQISM